MLLGVGVLVSGVARLSVAPTAYDPWFLRGLVAAGLLVSAAVCHRSETGPVRQLVLRGVALMASAWVLVLLYGNAFAGPYAFAMMPVAVLGLLAFHGMRESATFLFGLALTVVVVAWAAEQVDVGLQIAGSCLATGGVVLGAVGQRSAWTEALVVHRAELEAEVEARTSELRREVVVRRAAEIRAMAASESKSKFLANMSHELRTPLNAIIGYAELVREELADPDGSRQDARADLRRVVRAADRLLALVNDVLDLARIEADVMEILSDAMVLPDVITEVCEEVRPMAATHGNQVMWDLSQAPTLMRSDEARIRQILSNLLTNAAKFTRDGVIVVRASQHEQTVRVDVIDNGPGIPEDAMASLFDRFTQVDDSTTRVHGGTGLGLALSRDLARRMGGELFATSTYGQGSTFTLLMPIDAGATTNLRQVVETSSDDGRPHGPEGPSRMVKLG